MSTYLIRIYGWACDYEPCSESWEDADANGRAEVWRTLRRYGWRQRNGKHYCPTHSGAQR